MIWKSLKSSVSVRYYCDDNGSLLSSLREGNEKLLAWIISNNGYFCIYLYGSLSFKDKT